MTYINTSHLTRHDALTSLNDDYEVIAKVVQQPNCLECKIVKKGHKIEVEIEREFLVQVIGETKIWVKVDPAGHHHDHDDDWDFEVTEDELSDVDPDFLSSNKD